MLMITQAGEHLPMPFIFNTSTFSVISKARTQLLLYRAVLLPRGHAKEWHDGRCYTVIVGRWYDEIVGWWYEDDPCCGRRRLFTAFGGAGLLVTLLSRPSNVKYHIRHSCHFLSHSYVTYS